jgi:hypothetical protein
MNAPAPRHLDAVKTFEHLREAYFNYYNTPFGLSDSGLQAERQTLLDRDGGVFREPLLELRPEYNGTGRSLAESVLAAGAAPELAEFSSRGLLKGVPGLHGHQEAALTAGVTAGKNMVITAGTGSGKTESFSPVHGRARRVTDRDGGTARVLHSLPSGSPTLSGPPFAPSSSTR